MESDDDDVYYSPQHCFGQPSYPLNTAAAQQGNLGYPPPYAQTTYYPPKIGYGQPQQPGYGPQPNYSGLVAQQAPNYPPQINGGPQYGYPPPVADEFDQVKDHGDVYTGSPIWRDVWAVVLYVLNLVLFIGLAVWGTMVIIDKINHHNKTIIINDHDPPPWFKIDVADILNHTDLRSKWATFRNSSSMKHTVHQYVLFLDATITPQEMQAMALRTLPPMLGMSILISALYLFCVYKFTRAFIFASWWIYIISMVAGAGALFAIKDWIQAGMLLGFGLIYILCYFCWRSRIALAGLLLHSTRRVIRLHPTMLFVGVMGLLVQVLVTILWVLGISGGNARLLGGARIAVTVFLMFSYFWSSQVIKNVCHTTCSGVYATYYFLEGSGRKVANPVGHSAKRAMSYSFGSICFGSLLITIIQTLRWLARWRVVACFAECILVCLQSLAQYFSHYAYTQVAIYGKSFFQAARDTWHLVKDRNVDIIINDNGIATMLSMGQMFIGLLCGVIAWVIASNDNTIRSIPDKEWFAIILAIICGLFAILIMSIACGIIESGTATILICLAEDPAALKRSNPELFAKFLEKYPSILRPAREVVPKLKKTEKN